MRPFTSAWPPAPLTIPGPPPSSLPPSWPARAHTLSERASVCSPGSADVAPPSSWPSNDKRSVASSADPTRSKRSTPTLTNDRRSMATLSPVRNDPGKRSSHQGLVELADRWRLELWMLHLAAPNRPPDKRPPALLRHRYHTHITKPGESETFHGHPHARHPSGPGAPG